MLPADLAPRAQGMRLPVAMTAVWRGRVCGPQRAFTLACFALGLAAMAAPALSANPQVQWQEGLLTVQARGEPLGAVLQAVSQATGVAVKGARGLTQPVGTPFKRLPLADGLRLLMGAQSYVLVEGSRPSSTRLIVVGERELAPPMPDEPQAAKRGPAVEPGLESALRSDDPATRVEAVERLGERDDERSRALLRQALEDPADAVRAAANEALNAHSAASRGKRAGK